jgi:hypothetical protein
MQLKKHQKTVFHNELTLYESLLDYQNQLESYIYNTKTLIALLGSCGELSLKPVKLFYDEDLRLYHAKRLLMAEISFGTIKRSLGLSFVALKRITNANAIHYKTIRGRNSKFSYIKRHQTRIKRLQSSIFCRLIAIFVIKTGNSISDFALRAGDSINVFLFLFEFANNLFERFGYEKMDINDAFSLVKDVFGEEAILKFEPCFISGVNYLYPINVNDERLKRWMINPVWHKKEIKYA